MNIINNQSNKLDLFKYLEGVFSDLEQQKVALDKSAIVAITNTKGDITYINDKFCEISKYTEQELIGRNHRIVNSGFHPPEFFIALWKTISSGKIWQGEIKNRAKDGTYYWVSTTIVPYLDDKQKPYQYVSIRFDITKQKQQEEDLKNRTRQLEDFCFIISHNLRSPLSNLLILTSMLEASETYEDQKLLISKLSKPINTLNETFSELVESLQVKQDVHIEKELLNFEECLSDVMKMLSLDLMESDFELNHDFTDTATIIYSKKYLTSYLHNLLSNAFRYRSPERKLVINLSSYTSNGNIFLKVEDNGLGIDMKNHGSKLFGLRKTFHGHPDAKGFGLFITKTQVETLGGKISAESEFGKGTTFYIQF
jgi:PAS domain S-box-containing protein